MADNHVATWGVFRGDAQPHDSLANLPDAPPWRRAGVATPPKRTESRPGFDPEAERERGSVIKVGSDVVRAVNAALFLRRPLLITGPPGVGKSSIASLVAFELRMGKVLHWPVTSRSTVWNGLYDYDAIGRLQAEQLKEDSSLGHFLRLGPLGTALYPTDWPRTLLIDEIDKGDIDLPNGLLNALEEGEYVIPELARAKDVTVDVRLYDQDARVPITSGKVACTQYPFIVMTSNREREFPAPFLRRCIQLSIKAPEGPELEHILAAHLAPLSAEAKLVISRRVKEFLERRKTPETLATDQLLNAVFILLGKAFGKPEDAVEEERIFALLCSELQPQST